MPKTTKIARLSAELRHELDRRLHATGFGDLVQISEWLAESGHSISKTAVGVYSVENRQRIEETFRATSPAQLAEQDMRMRALEVASAVASTEQDLLDLAGRCLRWAKDADQKP